MDRYVEMHYYLTQLKNGFIHKNRTKLLDTFHDFAVLNQSLVAATLSQINPAESEVFWNFVESVCDHTHIWRDFICSEFSRLVSAANIMKDPSPVINSLEAFHILKDTGDKILAENMKGIIKDYLQTQNATLKRFLVWLFANCINNLSESELNLVKNLRFDDDVIVRYYAFISYNKYKGYPADKGLSEFDKLIIDISDIYVCDPAF